MTPWVFRNTEMEPQVDVQGSAAATTLGLRGFVALAVSEHDGELEQGGRDDG
jgi:hypothetical protein